jgi:hypothetical protein
MIHFAPWAASVPERGSDRVVPSTRTLAMIVVPETDKVFPRRSHSQYEIANVYLKQPGPSCPDRVHHDMNMKQAGIS